jgi:hypothetical protein
MALPPVLSEEAFGSCSGDWPSWNDIKVEPQSASISLAGVRRDPTCRISRRLKGYEPRF